MRKLESINGLRLHSHLSQLAKIGERPDGGVCRLAFSNEDLAGRTYVANQMARMGMDVRIDPIGNLFGIVWGQDRSKAVMIGSHTDTVATGGRYDGSLGVLAAMECAERMIEEAYCPHLSVVVASFVNEEGVRYMPDMMGSLFHSHQITAKDVLTATDSNGVSIGEEVSRLNFGGTSNLDDLDITAFLELHIEQGPILENNEVEIGVVTGVQGLSWQQVTVVGRSNHAGTTPMDRRQDAGAVSGSLMMSLRSLPLEIEGLRLTIGSLTYHPNLINVIPDKVHFTIDVRHPDTRQLALAEHRIKAILLAPTPCQIHSTPLARVEPCNFDSRVVRAVQEAADSASYSTQCLVSGAGHDAQILQSVYPSGMIFIPSRDGISHNVSEFSAPEHIIAGANVLLGAVLSLASEA